MNNKLKKWAVPLMALMIVGCGKKDGGNNGNDGGNANQPYVVDKAFASPNLLSSLDAGAVQADGKIVAGGSKGLIRVNTDGSLDASFKPPAPLNSDAMISSVAIQADGKILVSGSFITGNKVSIARLNSDGSLDNSFRLSTDIITSSPVIRTVLLQPDGKIIIIGKFDYPLGTFLASGIARLDAAGKLDQTFKSPRYSASFTTGKGMLLPDGKILIGINNGGSIMRLNTNGTIDPAFTFTTRLWTTNVSGIPGTVGTFSIAQDSKILAGGDFVRKGGDADGFNTTDRNGVLLLNGDGSEASFKSPTKGTGPVNTMLPLNDGTIMVGRSTPPNYNATTDYLTLLSADGSDTDFEVKDFPSGSVSLLLADKNNGFYMLGSFVAGVGEYKSIVRLKPR